jgi:glycosyltransferase involved in cell wall biosynthesis
VRIGIDARPALYGRSGIGVYVRELVGALARANERDHIAAYAYRWRGRAQRSAPPAWPANARLHDGPLPATAVRWLTPLGLGMERWLGGVDVMHATDYVVLPRLRRPLVATIHDVLFEALPDCYTPLMNECLRRATRDLVARAREVIVPAERVRAEVVRHYGADPAHVHVVPHGTPQLPPARPVVDLGRYVLAVGTLEPRKNLVRLLEALDRVRAGGVNVGAVVVGAGGWLHEPILAAIGSRPWVRHEPEADRTRIAALLRGAALLAYPSLGEGFGLPVLEGFAAEVPVLVGADTTAADVGGAGVLAVDPRDVDALASGVARLLGDDALRTGLVARGREVAAEHTWERTARLTRGVYERALAT